MYIVYYEGISMGERYDDPVQMGKSIVEFLDKFPKRKVRVEKYV